MNTGVAWLEPERGRCIVCRSREDRERWEEMLAREADNERIRLLEAEQTKPQEPEPEREEEREGELIRI
jgi:hypothetical protein